MPRPRIKPSAEQRKLVRSFAAFGISQEQIARHVGIRSPKTLRRHYRDELDQGAMEANAHVAQTLYKMAVSGQQPVATLFWLKCRAGWKERGSNDSTAVPPPPFIVAKEGDPV
jgi:hypothetical protein